MATKNAGAGIPKRSATKKPSEKSALSKSTNGKKAVEKGRKFEDQVAELYKLLGAQVVQNIEIHQKKVDILATFRIPGSSREHTVIVECKDEKRAVDANQRIMAFKGLLVVAREGGMADSAEIITRVPWSDQAKGFAKSSGIELFTYTEKISQLIDLSAYLKGLISKFDKGDPGRPAEPPLGSYYVDLSAQRGAGKKAEQIPVIDSYIQQWIRDTNSERQLAVFGEYGSGKSSLCQKLARDLALSYLNDPSSSRIPILMNLREFIGKLDLEAYIASFLDRECRVTNPRIELFRAMNAAGIFLMIFDGFDEMAAKVDADTLESNLIEIEKLAASPRSKVLLTSRPEYFTSMREENEAISPGVNPFLNREAKYEPLKILPWDESQVELFLQRRVPLVKSASQPWTYYRDQIKGIGSLSDLSQRPVLLEMIVKTLPRLIASSDAINLPNLYKNYLIGEMKRQKVLKKRTFLLNDDARFELLQDLATEMYSDAIPAITFADAMKRIERDLKPPKHELEAHTRDFLTNSFLVRVGDEYRFSHKSILEYLVAVRLNAEIQSNHPDIFGSVGIERNIFNFLREFKPDPLILIKWIEMTREKGHGDFLGPNAANLALRISKDALSGRDLSGTNLSMVNFFGADVRRSNLDNTSLINASFDGAKFFKEQIGSAKLGNNVFSCFVLKTRETRNYTAVKFFDFLDHKIALFDRIAGLRGESTFGSGLLWEIIVHARDLVDLEHIRQDISSALGTRVAIYFDECEQLAKETDLER